MIINTSVLAGIAQSFSTIFNEAFDAAPSDWPLFTMEVSSGGAQEEYPWLGDLPQMREWIGDRVLKDLAAFKYTIVNRDWEATIEVDRNDIEDDRVGLYRPKIQSLGDAAKRHPDQLIFALLKAAFETECYDGQYMVDGDHPVGDSTASNDGGGASEPWFLMDLTRPIKPIILQWRKKPEFVAQDNPDAENAFMRKKYRYGVDDRKNVGFGLWQLIYGSKDTLNATNYAAARKAMMEFTNDNDDPLGIRPTHLFVNPSNESAARTLLENMNNDAGASNPWYHTATLVVSPWLA